MSMEVANNVTFTTSKVNRRKIFKKTVGPTTGDSANLLFVLMRMSTRFLAKVELSRRVNMENVGIKNLYKGLSIEGVLPSCKARR